MIHQSHFLSVPRSEEVTVEVSVPGHLLPAHDRTITGSDGCCGTASPFVPAHSYATFFACLEQLVRAAGIGEFVCYGSSS